MHRTRTVELAEDQIAFLRVALEYVAQRVRDHPDDPALAGLARWPAAGELTLIASVESALADAADVG
jgi:hypothetical protein